MHKLSQSIIESFLFLFFLLIVATPVVVSLNLDPQLVRQNNDVLASDETLDQLPGSDVEGIFDESQTSSEGILPLLQNIQVETSGNIDIIHQQLSGGEYTASIRSTAALGEGEHRLLGIYNPSPDKVTVSISLTLGRFDNLGEVIVDDQTFPDNVLVIPPFSGREIGIHIYNNITDDIDGTFEVKVIN